MKLNKSFRSSSALANQLSPLALARKASHLTGGLPKRCRRQHDLLSAAVVESFPSAPVRPRFPEPSAPQVGSRPWDPLLGAGGGRMSHCEKGSQDPGQGSPAGRPAIIRAFRTQHRARWPDVTRQVSFSQTHGGPCRASHRKWDLQHPRRVLLAGCPTIKQGIRDLRGVSLAGCPTVQKTFNIHDGYHWPDATPTGLSGPKSGGAGRMSHLK